jgi:hypothetical protein
MVETRHALSLLMKGLIRNASPMEKQKISRLVKTLFIIKGMLIDAKVGIPNEKPFPP